MGDLVLDATEQGQRVREVGFEQGEQLRLGSGGAW